MCTPVAKAAVCAGPESGDGVVDFGMMQVFSPEPGSGGKLIKAKIMLPLRRECCLRSDANDAVLIYSPHP